MLVAQHLFVPCFGRLACVKKETSRSDKLDPVTHLIGRVHEDIVYGWLSVVIVFVTLIRWVSNYRVEFLIHGTRLAFHRSELERLVFPPVVYNAEGHRLVGLLFPCFFCRILEDRLV